MTLRLPRLNGMATQFALLLGAALILTNVIAAVLLAREGSEFDRLARSQADMGRLIALVSTLEETDVETADAILERSGTGYTRFSIDATPLAGDGPETVIEVQAAVAQSLPGRDIHVVDANPGWANPGGSSDRVLPLMLMSVQLNAGVQAGKWLNLLVYPLPAPAVWWTKRSFFLPLSISMAAALAAGLFFTRRITAPLRQLARAARAVGRGDMNARVSTSGTRELREAAQAFNEMQRRIADFDRNRRQMTVAIAHDLRTPITGLRLRAEMLEDDETRQSMVRILDEMAAMTSDLLRYGREVWDGGRFVETDPVPLIARLCADRGADFDSAATPPLRLRLRDGAFLRALGNLVDNALRYAGSARVRIVKAGPDALITVEDDGPGIPPDLLEAVLEPFVRGEASRSHETGGTGLGLAIARGIALDHSGSLSLRNRPGGGLSAELRLPLA